MRIVGTHHIAITTPDIARLAACYVDILGFPVIGSFAEHGIVFVQAGDAVLELCQEPLPLSGEPRAGWNHLAWEVERVDETYAELMARGVSPHSPPEDFPAPPDPPSLRIAFLRDPDGNLLELVQPLGARYPPE